MNINSIYHREISNLYNELEEFLSKLRPLASVRNNHLYSNLSLGAFSTLAFELDDKLYQKYINFNSDYEKEIKKVNEAEIRIPALKRKIAELYPNIKTESVIIRDKNFNKYKNTLYYSDNPVYSFISPTKLNVDEILNQIIFSVIDLHAKKYNESADNAGQKLYNLNNKSSLNLFQKLQKFYLEKYLSKNFNVETVLKYQAIKPYYNEIQSMNIDVKHMIDENGKTLHNYLKDISLDSKPIINQKEKLDNEVYSAVIMNISINLASIFSKTLESTSLDKKEKIKFFCSSVNEYLSYIKTDSLTVKLINKALYDFENILEIYQEAKKAYDLRKYQNNWQFIEEDLLFKNQDLEPFVKCDSNKYYLDTLKVPYNQLPVQMQFPYFLESSAKKLQKLYE